MNKQQQIALEELYEAVQGNNMTEEEIAEMLETQVGITIMTEEQLLEEMIGMRIYD